MKTGMLYEFDENKLKKDIEKGIQASIGIDADSLLNTINILEIQEESNPIRVINTLKHNLMILLGKIEEKETKETNGKKQD